MFQQQEIFRLSPDQLYTKKATCLQNIKPNCVELNFASSIICILIGADLVQSTAENALLCATLCGMLMS